MESYAFENILDNAYLSGHLDLEGVYDSKNPFKRELKTIQSDDDEESDAIFKDITIIAKVYTVKVGREMILAGSAPRIDMLEEKDKVILNKSKGGYAMSFSIIKNVPDTSLNKEKHLPLKLYNDIRFRKLPGAKK